jgi:hypothetical protein
MILLRPMTYAVIQNPVCIGPKGEPELTSFGQVKVKINSTEVRTQANYPEMFPLYPGEVLQGIFEATVAKVNEALKVKVIQEYTENGKTVSSLPYFSISQMISLSLRVLALFTQEKSSRSSQWLLQLR